MIVWVRFVLVLVCNLVLLLGRAFGSRTEGSFRLVASKLKSKLNTGLEDSFSIPVNDLGGFEIVGIQFGGSAVKACL